MSVDHNGHDFPAPDYIPEAGNQMRTAVAKVIEDNQPRGLPPPPRGRPFGRFRVGFDLIDKAFRDYLPLMGRFFVIRAQADYASRFIEYVALSDLFEVITEGEPIPFYMITVRENIISGGHDFVAERVTDPAGIPPPLRMT